MSGAGAGALRVASLNAFGRREDWPARRAVLADGFARVRPDLVAFQEVVAREEDDQVAEILGTGYRVVHHGEREADGQGISIASRWPVERVREVDLHLTARTAGFACTSLIAEIRAPAPLGRVLFVNHLPSWELDLEFERELQAVAAARAVDEALEEQGPAHVVVAGDFDADPRAASLRFWTGRQSLHGMSVCYRDAWESAHPGDGGGTFAAPENPLVADWDWPFRRIDYILVRCGRHGGPTLAIRRCERIFDGPGEDRTWASDHSGLVADLQPPPT